MVCHTLGDGARLPFVAIVAKAIPRLVRVREELLEGVPSDADDALVLARLKFDGQDVLVPDLSELERRLGEVI